MSEPARELEFDGDCYVVAAEMTIPALHRMCPEACPVWIEGQTCVERVRLVHGYPRLQVEPYCKHGHAWVEVCFELRLNPGAPSYHWQVYDWSNGKQISGMPRDMYYRLGKIEESEVKRYSPQEAQRMLVEHGTYGDWGERPEGAL